MKRFVAPAAVLLASLGLAGCNPVDNLDEAADQIDRFQSYFSRADGDSMYLMGSPHFRETTSRDAFKGKVLTIAGKLGPIEETQRGRFLIDSTATETRTVVTMKSRFEQGEGTETYTFVGKGENMRIEDWQVNAPLLNLAPAPLTRSEKAPQAQELAD